MKARWTMAFCECCGAEVKTDGSAFKIDHDPGCVHYRPTVRSADDKKGMLVITTSLEPIGKPRMTQRDKWMQRPAVMRYRAFKDELILHARAKGYRPELDVFQVSVIAHIPMPASWSQKKRSEQKGKPHRQKPDADNILKAVCDSLLADDSGIWAKEVRKYWAHEPGLHIIIYYYKDGGR